MNWVNVKTYVHPMDARMDILLLESEEIQYRMDNEEMVQIDPLISAAVGGVRLFVMEKDLDRATEILSVERESRKEQHPDEYLEASTPDYSKFIILGLLGTAVLVIVIMGLVASGLF